MRPPKPGATGGRRAPLRSVLLLNSHTVSVEGVVVGAAGGPPGGPLGAARRRGGGRHRARLARVRSVRQKSKRGFIQGGLLIRHLFNLHTHTIKPNVVQVHKGELRKSTLCVSIVPWHRLRGRGGVRGRGGNLVGPDHG